MRVAQKFAGYSLAEADNLRKACGKKIRELIAKERDEVRRRAASAPATAPSSATQLFDIIEPFADYAFNKSAHLRLRLHHVPDRVPQGELPGRVPRRLLTSVKSNLDKAAVYLNECRAMGIAVLVPDVNVSASRLRRRRRDGSTADAGGSPARSAFGLSAVRNVGEGARRADRRRARRERAVRRLPRLLRARRPEPVLNKRTVESLIKAGAFDSLGHPRQGLLMVVRADHRRHARPPPRARPGRDEPVRRRRRRRRRRGVRRARRRSPTSSSTRRERLRVREGDARPLRERPPADGRRGGAAAQGRLHDRRGARARGRRDAHRRRRRHRLPASSPRRAT